MSLSPGTKLGPYEILSALGAGGMGEVYRARDTRLKREVAIKVLPARYASDIERLQRFEQEARATAALSHPNILAVFDVGHAAGQPYVVSELLQGQTLRSRLQSGPLPVRKATEYALQIARGLAAAHLQGILHRDLKPENIFVTRDGQIKILDFGLAKLIQPESPAAGFSATADVVSGRGELLGTLGYMSPEQVRGEKVDARTDLFSFGSVLYIAHSRATPVPTQSQPSSRKSHQISLRRRPTYHPCSSESSIIVWKKIQRRVSSLHVISPSILNRSQT